MLPNGQLDTKTEVLATCPNPAMIQVIMQDKVQKGLILEWGATCNEVKFTRKTNI
jgi:hypothetical protein